MTCSPRSYLKTLLILSLAGTLFAGYLSSVKLFTGTCALNEPCPYFLGYPACWYGFAMFLSMLVLSIAALRKPNAVRHLVGSILGVSIVGIIFAGSFVWDDVTTWLQSGQKYALVLPSCVYGLIFYIAIFIIAILTLTKKTSEGNLPA